MEPIQLQCGSCGQMMAISPEHMGAQVQCPHCQAVVQTPARQPGLAAAPPPAPNPFSAPRSEHESIFSQPEPTDDSFGGSASLPRIEMPPEPPRPAANSFGSQTVTMEAGPDLRQYLPPMPPAPTPAHAPAPVTFMEGPPPAAQEDLTSFTPRRRKENSLLLPVVMMFLIPYAILTTGYIAYLLYSWPKFYPLDTLPDPGPGGKARMQVKHDLELNPTHKTALGQPLRVGDIEVTPTKVKHTPEGDLVLIFRAKNVSDRTIFNPIADEWMKFSRKSLDSGRPYTYLERLSRQPLPKLYGGNLEWFKGPAGREAFAGEIGPGEEAVIHLTSEVDYRKKEVPNVMKAPERLLWRVQVRRGFVPVESNKLVSATTVIGIEFTSRDIVEEKI